VTKVIIIGIILAGIIIGILAVSSLEIFSNMGDNDVSSEPILGKDGEDSGPEPKRHIGIICSIKIPLSI